MKKTKVGVLGIGEVGSSLSKVLSKKFNVLKKDLNYDEIKDTKIEILHISLPFSDNFINIVLSHIKINKPKLVIIHSTVAPGTTNKIFKKSKTFAVHSPVMGVHPHLAKSLLEFKKIIGPADKKSKTLAINHFKKIGIKVIAFKNPQESETAKLFDTTYYAWSIIFSKILWKICEEQKLDFKNVYTKLNEIYNTGFSKSKPNVIRPILKYQRGEIGGHCIIPNAELLEKSLPSVITKVIIEENKKFNR